MDIVIVGGGIIGTAIAARLADTGHEITLLERGEIGCETTAASAGILMRNVVDPTPVDLRLRERARAVYRPLLDDGPIESTRVGTLFVAETAAFAERLEASAATLRDAGVEASFLSSGELAAHGVEPKGLAGGLCTPNDRICDPTELARWFAACARAGGVDIRTGARVTDVITDGLDRAVSAVETDTGRLPADRVINATGPWAPELNDMVGLSLPLAHTLGPMAALESGDPLEGPVTIFESKRYVRPAVPTDASSGVVAWVGEYRTEYVEGQRYDPDTAAVTEGFGTSAAEIAGVVPALEGASVGREWIGLRTVTPDGRPLVGETSVEGFLVVCGLSGQGITLAPAVADVVAGVLEDEVRRALSPARF